MTSCLARHVAYLRMGESHVKITRSQTRIFSARNSAQISVRRAQPDQTFVTATRPNPMVNGTSRTRTFLRIW